MSTLQLQFTPELSAFQGIIISADFEYSFKDLSTKGGNAKRVESVINIMTKFLKSQNYINDIGIVKTADDTMRQFALYIVVNSDLSVLNELVSTDSTIDLLIWTVPTIPKYLMSEILWNLCMGQYVKEIITYSYPQLAIEVANSLITNVKYMNPTDCLKHLHILSTATFNMLVRIYFFDYEENLLKSAFNNYHNCMVYFYNPPNESKLEKLKKDDLYKYYGNCLNTMLTIIWECFTQYSTIQIATLVGPVALYEDTYSNVCPKETEYEPSKCTNKMITDILNKSLTEMLDTCMKLVMGVNLDIFCAWSEFEENGVTMQESVGQWSYKVRELLLNSAVCEHPVVSMLEQISRKPLNIKEIINETDSAVIIQNIRQNNSDSMQWLVALTEKDSLSEDLGLLQVIDANLNKLSESNCHELFQKLYNHDSIYTEHKQIIQILLVKLFQKCHKDLKSEIVDRHFKDGYFNNDMECTEFVCMLTEFFNKLAISPDADVSDVLTVFVQNPCMVFTTIFKSAIENEQQTSIMYKLMLVLAKYSNHYYNNETEPCLTIVLRNAFDIEDMNTEAKQDNLTKFISKLKHADIVSTNKLFLLIIMPQLHNSLLRRNYKDIHLQCKLIRKCYCIKDLLGYRAPMLAMLAQVMSQVRWRVNTFDILGPIILNLVIDLQTSLMNSYNGNIPENEVSWLKSKLKDLIPLNMYYYRELWNPPGNTFVEVVSGIHMNINMDTDILTVWLAQVLCSTTLQEWISIWDSLKEFGDAKTLDLFHNAMMSVLIVEKCNRTNTTWACVLHCYKNLFNCIRYKFFKEPLSNSQVSNVTNKLLTIICEIQEEYVEVFWTVSMPLFAYIAERKNDYNVDISQTIDRNLSESKLYGVIHNLFCNGSS